MFKRLGCLGLALALSGCLNVDVPEDNFFYPDARVEVEKIELGSAAPFPADAETIPLRYAGGPIGLTRVRTGRPDAPLILFCGGNMFRRGIQGGYTATKLAPFGDVLMFDYPGYGDTEGSTDFAGFRAVSKAVAASARAQADAEGRKLIAWGHSLGGPICAEAAKAIRADALVLEATTPSARAAVDQMVGIWRPLVRVNLAPALAGIDVPKSLADYPGWVVVLEAGRDDTLPPALSRRLARELEAEGVAVRRVVFRDAGHNDIGGQPDFVIKVSEALAP